MSNRSQSNGTGIGSSSRPETRAPGGPSSTLSLKCSKTPKGATASISTRPSGRLRTLPATPSSRAALRVNQRKPTPCTRPWRRQRTPMGVSASIIFHPSSALILPAMAAEQGDEGDLLALAPPHLAARRLAVGHQLLRLDLPLRHH